MQQSWNECAIESAKTLNTILSAGVGVCAVIVLLRVLGEATFEWAGVKLAISYAWIAGIAFTLAHMWIADDLTGQLDYLWESQKVDENRALFRSLTGTTGIFLRGLRPRLAAKEMGGRYYYQMDARDPTAWLSFASVLALVAALLPSPAKGPRAFVDGAALTAILVWLNWTIGTAWAVSISLLTVDREASVLEPPKSVMSARGLAGVGGSTLPPMMLFTGLYGFALFVLFCGTSIADLLRARGVSSGLLDVLVTLSRCWVAFLICWLVIGLTNSSLAPRPNSVRWPVVTGLAVVLGAGALLWIFGTLASLANVSHWLQVVRR